MIVVRLMIFVKNLFANIGTNHIWMRRVCLELGVANRIANRTSVLRIRSIMVKLDMAENLQKQPIGVLAALSSGFDIMSNQLGLLLVPIALDVFLWLGIAAIALSSGGFYLWFTGQREN